MARKTEQTWVRTAIALCCLLFCLVAKAEEEVEYKADMGLGLGGCFYMGDANSTPFANLSMMGAITARRILNPRMAVKANIAFGHIHGTSEGFIPTDAYSETPEGGLPTQVKFSRNVMDIGAQFELNFWASAQAWDIKATAASPHTSLPVQASPSAWADTEDFAEA